MRYTVRKPILAMKPALFALGAFLVITGSFIAVKAFASDGLSAQTKMKAHLLTIYDRDQQTIHVTDMKTVGEALEEAGIALDPKDAVEPARDAELVGSEYDVNIYRARPVTVVDGNTKQKIITPYQSATRIAEDAGISLYPEDTTTLARTDDILADGAGLVLTVDRATAFSFDLYGKKITARTQATSVGAMLEEKGIELSDKDKVSLALDAPIRSGMDVRVWREGKQTVTVDEDIAFDTETVQDADRPVGYSAITREGEKGKRSVTYEVTIVNGRESSRKEIASLTTKKPVTQIKVIGVKLSYDGGGSKTDWMRAAGIAESEWGYVDYIISRESGWNPFVWNSGGSGAYGLCQALPGGKMSSAGADWETNPVTQLRWCNGYAVGRYGSWSGAYNFWVSNHWW